MISSEQDHTWMIIREGLSAWKGKIENNPDIYLADLEKIPLAAAVADADGRMLNCNTGCAKLLMAQKDQLIGLPMGHFVPEPADSNGAEERTEARPARVQIKTAQGTTLLVMLDRVRMTSSSHQHANVYIMTDLSVTDINAYHQIAAQDAALSAIQEVSANAAHHEIKNYITSIQVACDLLQDDRDSEDSAAHLLNIIRHKCDKAMQLLSMHDWIVQLERGEYQSHNSPVELMSTIGSVLFDYDMLTVSKQLLVQVSATPTNGPLEVRCDQKCLSYALHNLLRHALEAAPRQSEVRIGVTQLGEEVEISVLIAGQLEAGYEPYLYEKEVPKNTLKGTRALGLYIIRRAMDCLNGRVSVEPATDTNSTLLRLQVPVR
jgi:signal transduction histidine kinase